MTNNGAAILDQTRDHMTRFVHFPSNAAATVATLWAAHTHVRNQLTGDLGGKTSPRLYFGSDQPGSGKSAALEMVGKLSYRPQMVIDPTPATHAIMNATQHNTVLADEVDVLFGAGGAKATLRSLYNSGYKANGAGWQRANGDCLSVFGPLAMAGLSTRFRTSEALSALRTRTFMIEMVKRPASSSTENYDEDLHGPTTDYMRNCLHNYIHKNTSEILSRTSPEFPGVTDRHLEMAKPLLKIADTVQGHWPTTARAAISEILLGIEDPNDTTEDPEDDLPLAERLFSDLAAIWPADTPKMSSLDVTALLRALPTSPWRHLWTSPAKAPAELKALLLPYGIEPRVLRFSPEPGDSARGYLYSDVSVLFPTPEDEEFEEVA